MVVWFIGLSGSGKTTLAETLYGRLKPDHPNLVLLDGDAFRRVFADVDHTLEGRRRNAERVSNLCRILDAQGVHVIAAVLSLFPEWQAWNRSRFSRYFEVFLDIPMETLRQRDPKGLYAGAEAGRVVGVVGMDIPFPRPPASDMIIDQAQQAGGVESCVDDILRRMPPVA